MVTAVTRFARALAWAVLAVALVGASAGCSSPAPTNDLRPFENDGTLNLALVLASAGTIATVDYLITGPADFGRRGSLDVSRSRIITGVVGGIPEGTGYTVVLAGASADGGGSTCSGSSTFDVVARTTSAVSVALHCSESARNGSVLIDGVVNLCPHIDSFMALPAAGVVGGEIGLTSSASDDDTGPMPLTYTWTASAGTLGTPSSSNTTFTCASVGSPNVTLTVSDGDAAAGCAGTVTFPIPCAAQ